MSIQFTKIKKELDLSDTMPFGKYLGLTLARVIVDDLRYMKWMLENSEQFFVSDKVHELIEKKEYEKHLMELQKTPFLNHRVDFDDDIPF